MNARLIRTDRTELPASSFLVYCERIIWSFSEGEYHMFQILYDIPEKGSLALKYIFKNRKVLICSTYILCTYCNKLTFSILNSEVDLYVLLNSCNIFDILRQILLLNSTRNDLLVLWYKWTSVETNKMCQKHYEQF